jgi:DNA-binding HxlR family transcriptional regulator
LAAQLAIGIKSRAHLRRLSVVFAKELRLKIVGELYTREMSPKQFFEEFGGGSLSRVTQNFERLAEEGWLRYIRSEGPGGKRRGAVEHFYRATELAFFDTQTWALVPYSMRVACSWSLFNQIALRLRQALEGSSLEARPKRDLSCTQLLLDQVGWERVIEALDAQFLCIFEEQKDARLRRLGSEEELIRADVLLIAFESPIRGEHVGTCLVESDKEPLMPLLERVAPVLADDVCMQIVSELNRREMSVAQFHREIGGAAIGGIRRRFKKLEDSGWLKKVDAKTGGRRRGATEYFYRATRPAITDGDAWANPPDALRKTQGWKTFERFSGKVKEAMRAGTFDARMDRYVTLSFLSLDKQGWVNVVAGIEALAVCILEEQERAKVRMKKSGEKPVAMTVGLGAFETPKDTIKAP